MNHSVVCFYKSATEVICNGTSFSVEEPMLTVNDTMFWVYLGIYVFLVLGAGLMSGLTLGLLSLDMMGLEVMKQAGTPEEQKYAKRIYPVIKRHHILLVTLLLGNAACVESMPIFLDKISNPVMAIVISVTAVLLFGEIIPQALCKRYGLAIGYYTLPIVYVLMALALVISWPIAKLLDWIFGHEDVNLYRRPQLKALVGLHGPPTPAHSVEVSTDHGGQGDEEDQAYLSKDEVLIIKGAIDMTNKRAADAMVPLDQVFMLSDEDRIDKATSAKILCYAHSRIPVYRGNDRKMIYGILLSKMFITVNPDDSRSVSELLDNSRYFRQVPYVTESFPLYDLLNMFQTGKSHMAIVVKDEMTVSHLERFEDMHRSFKKSTDLLPVPPPVIGIITLEDIMEQLIQEPIRDEGDLIRDRFTQMVARRRRGRQSVSGRSNPSGSHLYTSGRLHELLNHPQPSDGRDEATDHEESPLVRSSRGMPSYSTYRS